MVIRVLFLSAHWHGLAKLRMHTDLTLGIMDRLTTELGQALRDFEETVCAAYETHELPRETAARQRRQAKESVSQHKTPSDELCPRKGRFRGKAPPTGAEFDPSNPELKRPVKRLNLQTYKYHSLGDYVDCIRQYGTTDSYSTELVCFLYVSPSFLYSLYRVNWNIAALNPDIDGPIARHLLNSSPKSKDAKHEFAILKKH